MRHKKLYTTAFEREVLEFLCTIPRGKVVTYGQIATSLNRPGAARAVGNILHRNLDGEKYPCYKVVNSQGKLSCHYAFGGLAAQKTHLEQDGIFVVDNMVDLEQFQWRNPNIT